MTHGRVLAEVASQQQQREGLPLRRHENQQLDGAPASEMSATVLNDRPMNASRSAPPDSRHDEEARRYQQAAEDALEQLAWCIGYLHGIGKTNVSRALSRNGSAIRSALKR